MTNVAVLMTCHNRRATTVETVGALAKSFGDRANFQLYLADAGSSDGTADGVRTIIPNAVILNLGTDVYWNQGMLSAWRSAVTQTPDFFLWLNDDTKPRPGALAAMLDEYDLALNSGTPKTIIVGRTIDSESKETTYGGVRHSSKLSRISWRFLTAEERECDTMNGNCVLIPFSATQDIGLLDERFSHSFGDIDYGLRARHAGYRIIQSATIIAEQAANAQVYAGSQMKLTFRNLAWVLSHPKGIPVREWFYFCRRHAGPMWPVNFAIRYIKMFSR